VPEAPRLRVALLAALVGGCGPGPEALSLSCQVAMDAKNYAEAVTTCRAALAVVPEPANRQRLMRALFQVGDLDAALAEATTLSTGPHAAAAWRIIGRVHERSGRADEARQAFEKALAGHVAEGAPGEAAYDAHALAGSYWRAGEYRKALIALQRTLSEAEKARDARMKGYALLGIGTLLNTVGDPAGAERAFSLAAADLGALTATERANLTIERGIVQLKSGRPESAHALFLDALAIATEAKSVRYRRVALENLGRVSQELGRIDEAQRHTAEAAALIDQDPDEHDTTFIRVLEGQIARRQGRWVDARAALEAAAATHHVPEMAWLIALERGNVARAEGRLAEAEAAFNASIAGIEALRSAIGVEELKRAFIGAKKAPFEALFTVQADAGRARDAAATLERALARNFLDAFLVPPTEVSLPPGTTPVLPESGPADAPAAAWNAAATRADELKTLISSVTASGVAMSRPLADTLTALGDRVVLAWYTAEGRAWWVRFGGGDITLRRVSASPDEVASAVDALLANVDDRAAASQLSAALELSAVLPPPGTPRVYFAPTGPLVRVPFGVLPEADGQPLAARREVLNVPGPAALAAMLRAPTVAYGPPVVIGDARGDLPGAAIEARTVATRLGVTPRLGAEAVTATLRDAGHPRVLHVATHAGNGPTGPWLALADAHVGTGSLLEMHIDAELVVLAGCACAAGHSWEMWGSLAATSLAGGARNVLATLRSVDDGDARRFVQAFYAAGGDRQPARAFAAAQRTMLAGPPSNWAHFVLLGTGDPAP
jgi:tetratricopeptide (TPR) repeat protein